ncbi:alpha/beta hydrolase [Flagellimonas sp. HMM57]|uniref:alpha/beta fold hydrolase n=1 Tax=unclassified Flagellimonas TaxID=2644544 RepID=UPI0013D3050E|nr:MULTISPECIES: alpha/beta hydrolase [unclassified Flagellimonas]UII77835.1 alpha/beta hydrolase [Flagellimonas sp. HMM57]
MKKIRILVFALVSFWLQTGITQTSNILTTNFGSIHYKTFGKGEPLLIINGGPGIDCEGFSSLASLLKDDYMAIIYDQRGTGKSDLKIVDSSTLSMDLLIDDIEILRNHLKIKNWIVLGHSFGGFVAQHYASKHSDRIKGMILSASGGIDTEIFSYIGDNVHIRMSDADRDALRYWNKKIAEGDTTYLARYKIGELRAPAYLYGEEYIEQIAHRLTQSNPEVRNLMLADLSKHKYDWSSSMSKFKAPVLIIQGRQDLVGSETAYRAHNVYSTSKLVLLNKCGHYGWLEQEEKYMNEIKAFIESLG